MREWAALHCLAHMPLREVLLSARVRGRGRGEGEGQAGNAGDRGGRAHRRSTTTPRASTCWAGQLQQLPSRASHLPRVPAPPCPQPSQSLLAARGKLEVPPQMAVAMRKTYNDSQASRGC